MKKAVIYSRVSDPGQMKGPSIEVQIDLCKKWAEKNGHEVVGVYTDGGKSGTKTVGRDGLEEMIIRCQTDKDIDAALSIDTDRIARDEYDHFSIKRELAKVNTQFIAVNQPMIDNSPEGRLMDGMLASINAFYSRLTGRKVKKSLEKKLNDGWWPGWAPLGYLNINRGTEDKPIREIIIDSERGHFITELFRLYSTGRYSVDELVDMINTLGLRTKTNKPIYRNVIYNVLKNPFYIKQMRCVGIIYEGKQIHSQLLLYLKHVKR